MVVFAGADDHLTDRRLHNGRRYRYVVTLIDQAGNRSADAASAVPTGSRLLLPARGAHVHTALRRSSGSRSGGRATTTPSSPPRPHKILTRWPRAPQLHLRKLAPGATAGTSGRASASAPSVATDDLLGKSCFTVVRG